MAMVNRITFNRFRSLKSLFLVGCLGGIFLFSSTCFPQALMKRLSGQKKKPSPSLTTDLSLVAGSNDGGIWVPSKHPPLMVHHDSMLKAVPGLEKRVHKSLGNPTANLPVNVDTLDLLEYLANVIHGTDGAIPLDTFFRFDSEDIQPPTAAGKRETILDAIRLLHQLNQHHDRPTIFLGFLKQYFKLVKRYDIDPSVNVSEKLRTLLSKQGRIEKVINDQARNDRSVMNCLKSLTYSARTNSTLPYSYALSDLLTNGVTIRPSLTRKYGGTDIKTLELSGIGLSSVNLSDDRLSEFLGMVELINLGKNKLSSLIPGMGNAVTTLDLFRNLLTSLILNGLPNLKILNVSENKLTQLDLTPCPLISKVAAWKNRLSSIKARGKNMRLLAAGENRNLENIDVDGRLPNLLVLDAQVIRSLETTLGTDWISLDKTLRTRVLDSEPLNKEERQTP